MIETYLSGRDTLKGVVVIMDIRRLPRVEEDNLTRWLDGFHIPIIRVVTKADKLSKTRQKKQLDAIAGELLIDRENLLLFSAKSGMGKEDVWRAIENLIINLRCQGKSNGNMAESVRRL